MAERMNLSTHACRAAVLGTAVATASGQVSTHAYLAFGQWHRAHRYGCRFSA
jgi:hypothetical protein